MIYDLTTVTLLVACPLAWFALDVLRKLLADRGRAVPVTFVMVAAQIPLYLLWLLYAGDWSAAPGYWFPGMVSLALNIVANVAYMQAVRVSPMSVTLPLLALTPAFSTLAGVPLLGEVPGLLRWVGVWVVVLGAFLLNSDSKDRSPLALGRAMLREKGSLLMLLVALCWSVAPVFDKLAMHHASGPLHALILTVGIALSLLAVLLGGGRWREVGELRSSAALLAASALVSFVALLIQLWAIQVIWVGLLETVKRGVGALLALVVARQFFAEHIPPRRVVAVMLMCVGVWLVLV